MKDTIPMNDRDTGAMFSPGRDVLCVPGKPLLKGQRRQTTKTNKRKASTHIMVLPDESFQTQTAPLLKGEKEIDHIKKDTY